MIYNIFLVERKGVDSGMQLINPSEYFQCVSAQMPPIVPHPFQ